MNSLKVLHITTHLGGGLGTAIGSYIAQSELDHSVLELEKSINPSTSQFNLNVKTFSRNEDFERQIMNYDVLLIHYYCHPLITWALLEINRLTGHKVVVWCHNNGKDVLHPLPDDLNKMADLVILSGCKDDRFNECDIIRPAPLSRLLNDAATKLLSANKDDGPSFRYIGSLDESKIHPDAFEWFEYISENWKFEIATLDLYHRFSKFKVLTGETNRSVLYDQFFCLVYPLNDTHYGCGELGLQELLMLGYPVIVRRNCVETEIVDGLSGVYFADSINELHSVCSAVVSDWRSVMENWRDRSAQNTKIVGLRNPYHRLDLQLTKVHKQKSLRRRIVRKPDSLDILKFAYNQKNDNDLKKILLLWKDSGRGEMPTKGSPAQFVKYFPDLGRSVFSLPTTNTYE